MSCGRKLIHLSTQTPAELFPFDFIQFSSSYVLRNTGIIKWINDIGQLAINLYGWVDSHLTKKGAWEAFETAEAAWPKLECDSTLTYSYLVRSPPLPGKSKKDGYKVQDTWMLAIVPLADYVISVPQACRDELYACMHAYACVHVLGFGFKEFSHSFSKVPSSPPYRNSITWTTICSGSHRIDGDHDNGLCHS